MKKHTLIPLGLAATALILPATARAAESDWTFDVTPYFWLASIDGEANVPEPPSGGGGGSGGTAASNVQQFETDISGGFMIAAQARYKEFGLYVDFNWLQLDTRSQDPGTLYSDVQLKSNFRYTTAAVTYTLPFKDKFTMEVLGGARIWTVANTFQASSGLLPGFETDNSETWAHPLFGVHARYGITKHWLLLANGTISGVGSDSFQYDLFGGVAYQFNDWLAATIGYRYLHENYEQDDFVFNAEINGMLIGVGFQF